MVGHVQHNGRIHSPRLHQRTQSTGETAHLRNKIIRRINSMPNIFHPSGITDFQKRADDVHRTEERSVNQQAGAKQQYEYARQPSGDSDMPRSIRENYSSGQGDLLYGLGEERFELLQKIYPGTQAKDKVTQLKDIPVQYIDSMNYAKKECAMNAVYNGSASDEFTYFRKEYQSSENVDAYIHTMRQQSTIGEKKPKFNVRKGFEDFFKLRKELIKNDEGKLKKDSLRRLNKEFYNIIKRGCKAGIMSAPLDGSKHHIHFSLDGIDMDGVVTKTSTNPRAGTPAYTGVELRCAYRLRDQLKDKLHFYENGLEVSAPWKKNPELWRKYIPKGAQKKDLPDM
ncbi:hypothetical protein DPS53_24905 [Salmonella enterica subsp. enterica serovar Bareilly]|uniref:Uncharacterized protein n=1 Tax=Salmonella enterica subsp. enterica serovar Bareilly TaxID=58096 RepID=A0A5U9T071_SALET|nr:hypothetical protein [Salmonella enterica subsp. enterica serovar Bareilly]HAF6271141.1 hypothetical protein [Salmonella enterica]